MNYPGEVLMKTNGFTLIELLVVVLVIGILAAVAMPQYERAVEKSRVSEAVARTRAIWTAQQAYLMSNGSYATDLADLDLTFTGTPTNAGGTPSLNTKDYSCRAVNAGATADNAFGIGVCRRNGKPYAIYYARGDEQLACYYDNDEGEKWCQIFTGKTEAPYYF